MFEERREEMSLKKNLDVVVFEQLREKVIRGEWTPGQAISIDELVTEYGVSRTPILQALRRMEAVRMVEITITGHFMVPKFTKKQVEDLTVIRALLEQEALETIQKNRVPIDLTEVRKQAELCAVYNKAGDYVEARKADLRYHLLLTEAADNRYLADIYERIQAQFMVANYLITSHIPEKEQIAAEDHGRILDALEAGDYEAARERIHAHIYGARDKMIARIEQMDLLSDA